MVVVVVLFGLLRKGGRVGPINSSGGLAASLKGICGPMNSSPVLCSSFVDVSTTVMLIAIHYLVPIVVPLFVNCSQHFADTCPCRIVGIRSTQQAKQLP